MNVVEVKTALAKKKDELIRSQGRLDSIKEDLAALGCHTVEDAESKLRETTKLLEEKTKEIKALEKAYEAKWGKVLCLTN